MVFRSMSASKHSNESKSTEPKSIEMLVKSGYASYIDYNRMSSDEKLDFSLVKMHPEYDWNWAALSDNPSLTLEIVESLPNSPWNWSFISSNPSIAFENVKSNPSKPWDWFYLSENLRIT